MVIPPLNFMVLLTSTVSELLALNLLRIFATSTLPQHSTCFFVYALIHSYVHLISALSCSLPLLLPVHVFPSFSFPFSRNECHPYEYLRICFSTMYVTPKVSINQI